MDINKSERVGNLQKNSPIGVRVGSFIRVRVFDKLDDNSFKIEFRGKHYAARMHGSIKSKIFIAQVLKLSPKLELKFIKGLEGEREFLQNRFFHALLKGKKSFIENLVVTDKVCVNPEVITQKEKKSLKASIKESIKNQNIAELMKHYAPISEGKLTYFILQNLYNLLAYDSYIFLLPFMIGKKNYIIDLKTFGGKESESTTFFLIIHLENEKKIGFFIYVDYEMVSCTISTNSASIEKRAKSHIQILRQELKTLNYNRNVRIQFVPYSEDIYLTLSSLKRIDIRM